MLVSVLSCTLNISNQLLHGQPHYNHFDNIIKKLMTCNVDQTISTCKPFYWFSNYISLGVEEIVIHVIRSCQKVSQR